MSSAAPEPAQAAAAPAQDIANVFVGNLNFKSTQESIQSAFVNAGVNVLGVNIVKHSGRSRGYAFVNVGTQANAEKAVAALNASMIDEREVKVEVATASEPREAKPRHQRTPRQPRIDDAAKEGEVDNADGTEAAAVKAKKPRKPRAPRNKKADDEESTPSHVEDITEGVAKVGVDKPARPPRAPRTPRGPPTGEPSKTLLFVANLPFSMNDEALSELFTGFGASVKSARVIMRNFGKRSKGFGFVDLVDEANQKIALEKGDGHEIEGRQLAVKIAINDQAHEAEHAASAAPAS